MSSNVTARDRTRQKAGNFSSTHNRGGATVATAATGFRAGLRVCGRGCVYVFSPTRIFLDLWCHAVTGWSSPSVNRPALTEALTVACCNSCRDAGGLQYA